MTNCKQYVLLQIHALYTRYRYRLETQMTALVAVLSGVLHFSRSDEVTLATCKFLTHWLSSELHAQSSHAICSNLVELAHWSKEKDENIFGAFLAGFFKATDCDQGAARYFEETDLIKICRNCVIQDNSARIQQMSGDILLEYLLFLENSGNSEQKYNWTSFGRIVLKSKMEMSVKCPLVLKIAALSEEAYHTKDVQEVIGYLRSAFKDGKVAKEFIDPDIPGEQVDITWIRAMSYLVKVCEAQEKCRALIRDSDWPLEIVSFLAAKMTKETTQQSVIALFSHLLQSLQVEL